MMKRAEVKWNDTLDLERVRSILDAPTCYVPAVPWTERVLRGDFGDPLAFCHSRASGYWFANDREYHVAYRSLAALIEAGAVAV